MTAASDAPAAWPHRLMTAVQGLRHWPWLETLRTLRQRFREDRLGLTAGSLTFTTLIALVPLVTVMLAVFSAFPMFASFQGALEKYFLEAALPDGIGRPVLRSLTQFAAKARGMGTAGLALLVATALALMLTIDRTLNTIWRVRRPRRFGHRVLLYWAALTLGPLLLGVSLTTASYALSASRGLVSALPGGLALLLDTLEFALAAAVAAGLYRFVPNVFVAWRHAWAGGLFVAVGLELAKKALAGYVATVPTFSAVYGAFATAPILLLWVYLVWVIVLLGAVIAAYAPSLQMGLRRAPAGVGAAFDLAVMLLREIATAQRTSAPGLTLHQLAGRLRIDPLQLEPVLQLLIELDWVARLDDPDEQRHVLLAHDDTPALPLVERLVLQPGPVNEPFRRAAGLDRLTLRDLL